MAYKFQIGQSILSGSVTFKEGLSANDASISNVNDIAVDSISADGTDIDIKLSDNSATALEIKEGNNVYQKFITTDGSEAIEFMKPLDFGNQAMTNVNIDSGAIELTALNIDGGTALGGATVAQADLLIIDDGAGGTNKSVTFSNFEDSIFGNISGDATVAAGGALTIAAGAVEHGMLAEDIISGQNELGHAAIADADDLMIHDADASAVKKVGVDSLRDHYFGVVSGDATIADGGALTIANDAVEQAMIADDAVGADQLAANAVVNASIASNAAIDIDKLDGGSCASSLAAAALAQGDLFYVGDASDSNAIKSATLSDVEDRIFANVSSDATIAAGGALTLAAAQTNVTSMINSSMGKIGTDAAQEYIDFGTSNEIKFAVNNSLVASCEAGKFVVNGDLQVNGTTTSVNSTTINISSSFTFEGPADAHETVLSCGSPTADATLELFQGAAGTYYMPAFSDANIKSTVIAATAAEINLMDGGTARGTTALADGDGFIHNDNGTMKQTNVLKMFEYTVAKFSGDATVADTGVLTIAAAAVHHGMLNDDIISGQNELGAAAIADADDLMIHDADASAVKKVGVDSLRDHFFGVVSGDVLIADGGAATIQANAVESGMLNDNVISGQTELASGNAVDADEMLISDGGTLKKIGLDSLKVYMSDIAADVAIKAAGNTLAVGVNYFADMSADGEDAVTLPASADMSVGQSVKVKAPSDCSSARYITINRAGSQTIDGETSIRLESPFAAVELVYVAADTWRVF